MQHVAVLDDAGGTAASAGWKANRESALFPSPHAKPESLGLISTFKIHE